MDPVDSALCQLRDLDHPIFSSHGPMAVEALENLGFGDRAPAWAAEYAKSQQLTPLSSQPPLSDAELGRALGDPSRRGAWVARLAGELEGDAWTDVVRRWLPQLLPGMSCEAAHGLIRTAHAIRSLGRRDSPARRYELAEALGYWAATFETLPGAPGSGRPGLASEALRELPAVPADAQVWQGSIVDRLRALDGLAGFAEGVAALAPGEDVEGFADDLARSAAALYLANAPRARVIDFIHALDGVYAVRELIPWLEPAAARDALFYGWQVVAALHASAGGPIAPGELSSVCAEEIPALVARAVEIGGAHAIKFAQACRAEQRHRPDPLFPAALLDAVTRMEELSEKLGVRI